MGTGMKTMAIYGMWGLTVRGHNELFWGDGMFWFLTGWQLLRCLYLSKIQMIHLSSAHFIVYT